MTGKGSVPVSGKNAISISTDTIFFSTDQINLINGATGIVIGPLALVKAINYTTNRFSILFDQ